MSVLTGSDGRSLLERSLPVVSVLRVPPESSTQGSSCVFAGVVLRRTQDLGWSSDSKTPQAQSLPVVSVLTGSDGLPVRTLDLGWSSDAKTPQAQSLLVASSSVCVFSHWLGLHKKRWQGSSKDLPKHFNFQKFHLNFGLHSSGAVSHYHATKGSVICLQLLGLCLSSFFDNLQLVLIPLGVSWAYLPSPAVSAIQLVSCRMLESVLGVPHSPVVL